MTKRKRKELSPHYKANDEGGFGNPPVSGQFKGKPGPGRPRGGTSLVTAIQRLLKEKVTVNTENGRVQITMTDAILRRLRKEILTGSMRGLELGLQWLEQYGPKDEEQRDEKWHLEDFSPDESTLLRSILLRVTRQPNPGAGNDCGTYRAYVRSDGYLGFEMVEKAPYQHTPGKGPDDGFDDEDYGGD